MSMLWQKIARFLAADGKVCLVTLLVVKGSSPREAGARMVVRVDGRFSGTIGGGALEWQALAEAQKLMRRHPDGAGRQLDIALGPDLGQCCGGRVSLLIEAFSAPDHGWIVPLAVAEADTPFNSEGRQDSRGIFHRVPADSRMANTEPQLIDGLLLESFGTLLTPLLLFGAGHVGRALVLALAPLPFAIRWIDPRRSEFPDAFPANVTPVAPDDPVSEITAAKPGTSLLAMTHSHPLDLAIIDAALRNRTITHLGVIGSMTKRARFSAQLRAAGHADVDIARMICPIGLPTLRDKAPAIIATGVAVQLLEWRAALTASETTSASTQINRKGQARNG